MELKTVVLHTTNESFDITFKRYKEGFLSVLSNSYQVYYGDNYQLRRIVEEKSALFIALADDAVVGASYIKSNFRRGGTAVYPEEYRRLGIAETLVKESLKVFPHQYTIFKVGNHKMVALMEKLEFKKANTEDQVRNIVKNEFSQFSGFRHHEGFFVFNRYSVKREMQRETLTLMHTF